MIFSLDFFFYNHCKFYSSNHNVNNSQKTKWQNKDEFRNTFPKSFKSLEVIGQLLKNVVALFEKSVSISKISQKPLSQGRYSQALGIQQFRNTEAQFFISILSSSVFSISLLPLNIDTMFLSLSQSINQGHCTNDRQGMVVEGHWGSMIVEVRQDLENWGSLRLTDSHRSSHDTDHGLHDARAQFRAPIDGTRYDWVWDLTLVVLIKYDLLKVTQP